jgi:hypothetical protein
MAARFAAAWAQPTLSAARWWAQIAPLCSPAFAQALRTVDPGNVPASRVTGTPQLVSGAATAAVYRVPTNGGQLSVTVTRIGAAWLVTNNDFQRS